MAQLGQVQAATFALAIFISAFLLFQVQPLIGKFILPWFGGSPAVWTTCMLFFQVTLFLGYAYAHAITRWLTLRQQRTVHLLLMLAALAALPIAPDSVWKPVGSEHPTGRILMLLASTVGLSYFVLSSTGPLLQAWFSSVCAGRSPYRLYALSNAGSLLALITYPLVFEPLWPSTFQANVWSIAFVLFALICGTCAVWSGRVSTSLDQRFADNVPDVAPRFWQRVLWLLLPACSCLMLVATTNEVTQDVAPMPFLWVVPLSLYLLSFIICFDHEAWYRRGIVAPLTAIAVLLISGLSWWTYWLGISLSTAAELVLYFTGLFGVCMVCHGEVVRLRPSPRHLTEFYLLLSAGGAVGGIFVSLIAPDLFTTYFEWSLCLLASFAVACMVSTLSLRQYLMPTNSAEGTSVSPRRQANVRKGLLAALITAEVLAFVQIMAWESSFDDAIYRGRNFYGTVNVHDVVTDENQPVRVLLSGHISHGRQWLDEHKRRIPTAYYGEGTAADLAARWVQSRPDVHIGVVGLGVGTMSAYARPTDRLRFYEINPEVELIARKYFTFLDDCLGKFEVVLGDARLALEREAPNQFDLLVLDAFTSDAPPMHLLTREAFRQYDRHIRAEGLLIVNVTNTYLDLAPVVARVGLDQGWKVVRLQTVADPARLAYRTDYLVFAREMSHLPQSKRIETIPEEIIRAAPVWTDQYSNLFQVLKSE